MKKLLLTVLLPLAAFGQAGYNGPGRYEIMSNVSRKVLDLDRNDQRTIIQFDSRGTDNQTWDIQDAGGGFVILRNGMNGYALTQTRSNNSEPVAGQPANNSDAQRWRLESGNNGSVILVNASGKALDIPNGSTNNGVKINTYDRNNEVNQQWSLRPVSGNFNQQNNNNRSNRQGNSRYDNNNNNNNNRNNDGYNNNRLPPKNNGMGAGAGNQQKYFDQTSNMWKIDGDGACFYTEAQYRGEAFCVLTGDERRRMSNDWNNSFTSIRFFGRASKVEVFDQQDLRGRSEAITRDVPNMRNVNRGNWNNRVSSFRVN
jgi:Ricin-type beta-trefoil lectin domain-like